MAKRAKLPFAPPSCRAGRCASREPLGRIGGWKGPRSCPGCGETSKSQHGWHTRHLQDLPIQGVPVTLTFAWRAGNVATRNAVERHLRPHGNRALESTYAGAGSHKVTQTPVNDSPTSRTRSAAPLRHRYTRTDRLKKQQAGAKRCVCFAVFVRRCAGSYGASARDPRIRLHGRSLRPTDGPARASIWRLRAGDFRSPWRATARSLL